MSSDKQITADFTVARIREPLHQSSIRIANFEPSINMKNAKAFESDSLGAHLERAVLTNAP